MNSNASKTILVIDDDETLRELLGSMLKRMGYTVHVAENGKQAIQISESIEETIDIAILDLFLPDMRGDKVCPQIQTKHPGLKIIVMSGYGLQDTAVLNTTVHGFIQKPCTYEMLSKTIESLN
ncbi:MAG: response regulator [Proteobacteria bacterium]|nr:response regulator [Pseudomonadota bacterium]